MRVEIDADLKELAAGAQIGPGVSPLPDLLQCRLRTASRLELENVYILPCLDHQVAAPAGAVHLQPGAVAQQGEQQVDRVLDRKSVV